jgi:hypothetical protein
MPKKHNCPEISTNRTYLPSGIDAVTKIMDIRATDSDTKKNKLSDFRIIAIASKTSTQNPAQAVMPLAAFQALIRDLAFSATLGKAHCIPCPSNSMLLCKNGGTGIPFIGNGTRYAFRFR